MNIALSPALGVGVYLLVWWICERFGIIWLPMLVAVGAAVAGFVD
jgi:hypothetical protein